MQTFGEKKRKIMQKFDEKIRKFQEKQKLCKKTKISQKIQKF